MKVAGIPVPSRPFLLPVSNVCLKLQRHTAMASAGGNGRSLVGSFAMRRFYPHIIGLGSFRGRKVLEVGGTDQISMEPFFRGIGASYLNVRLEGNPSGNPAVMVGDFMDVRRRFDLIVSLGVFEPGAIDVNFDTMEAGIIRHTPSERVSKLASLLASGGSCVIGTISAPCFFSDRAILSAGFSILQRESPFYSFMNAGNSGLFAPGDRSELLVISKK